jgi:hypothetical protein
MFSVEGADLTLWKVDEHRKEPVMVHAALITAHAASGISAFAAGCAAIWRRRAFRTYFWSLVALVAFAAAAVTADWPRLAPAPGPFSRC